MNNFKIYLTYKIKVIRNLIKYFRVIMIYKRMLKNNNFISYIENVDKDNEDNKLYNELYKEIKKFK
jgi:hypothetical protein